jgi:nucleoside-diphosphate-sugar epimerase
VSGLIRVLFIGGTGVISSACAREAVSGGHDIELFVLNRGQSAARPLPPGVRELRADVRDAASVRDAVHGLDFDCVVDFIAYTPRHVRADLDLFRGRTYDATKTVLPGGWTSLRRMLAGKPVIVHGDGTSLWTVTHHTDFARAFVPLLGHPRTVGEAFHITSDDVLTWDQIAHALGRALGVSPRVVHVPSDVIAARDPAWGAGLLGDKAHSMVFDNAKVKSVVPGWRAVVPFGWPTTTGFPDPGCYLASSMRKIG